MVNWNFELSLFSFLIACKGKEKGWRIFHNNVCVYNICFEISYTRIV